MSRVQPDIAHTIAGPVLPTPDIHETAVVEDGAVVHPGARIWHHAHVRPGASVGDGTSLGKNVFVDVDVRIGSRTKIQNNVSVYHGVSIGDDVFVGPSVVFTNDKVPRAFGSWNVVPTFVERGASIGANATVLCGITIGAHAMVGAGSVVTRDVEAHEVVAGNPARHVGWVCRCGKTIARDASEPPVCSCMDRRP